MKIFLFLTVRLLFNTCQAYTLNVALCQLQPENDKTRNIAHAREMIDRAAATGADMIILPEIWNSPYATEQFPLHAEVVPPVGWTVTGGAAAGPSVRMLSERAMQHNIVIVGGSIPERSGAHVFNTALVMGPTGEILATHRKVHLFDIDIPGKMTFKESETLTAGDQVTTFQLPAPWAEVVVGLGICYDLRFPEYASALRQRGANLLIFPGAFNTVTGPLHWELLGRARAVDEQLFVALVSPARVPGASYQAWGHSMVVDPLGEVLATTDESESIVVAQLDFDKVETIRKSIPTATQKRPEVYAPQQHGQCG